MQEYRQGQKSRQKAVYVRNKPIQKHNDKINNQKPGRRIDPNPKKEKINSRIPGKKRNIRNQTNQSKFSLSGFFHTITGHEKKHRNKKKTPIIKRLEYMAKENA